MGVKTYSAVFVLGLIIGSIIWLPASLVLRWVDLPQEVQISQVEGTLWQGRAQLNLLQQPVSLSWQLQGLNQLGRWDLALLAPGLNLGGLLDARQLSLIDWNGRIQAGFINSLLAQTEMTQGTVVNGELELRGLWLISNWQLQPTLASGRIISTADSLTHTFFGMPQTLNIPMVEFYLSAPEQEQGFRLQMVDSELDLLLNAQLYQDRSFDYQVYRQLPESVGVPVSGSGAVVASVERGEPLF